MHNEPATSSGGSGKDSGSCRTDDASPSDQNPALQLPAKSTKLKRKLQKLNDEYRKKGKGWRLAAEKFKAILIITSKGL